MTSISPKILQNLYFSVELPINEIGILLVIPSVVIPLISCVDLLDNELDIRFNSVCNFLLSTLVDNNNFDNTVLLELLDMVLIIFFYFNIYNNK